MEGWAVWVGGHGKVNCFCIAYVGVGVYSLLRAFLRCRAESRTERACKDTEIEKGRARKYRPGDYS
jgi:hypothetical protein